MSSPRAGRGERLAAITALSALATAGVLAQEPADGPAYVIVVHRDVVGTVVSRELLKQIFLREVDAWGDGQEITVVDQSLQSPVRESFSRDLLGRTPQEVLLYWRQKIRFGVRPPMVKESDAEVLEYVASKPGAIGYVSGEVELEEGTVKVLRVADREG